MNLRPQFGSQSLAFPHASYPEFCAEHRLSPMPEGPRFAIFAYPGATAPGNLGWGRRQPAFEI